MDNSSEGFWAAIALGFIIFIAAFIGSCTKEYDIVQHCNSYEAFSFGNKVYECELRKEE